MNRQVAAIYGLGQILAATFVLALFGLVVIWRELVRSHGGVLMFYGLAVCAVPASLTKDYFTYCVWPPCRCSSCCCVCPRSLGWRAHQTKRAWRLAFVAAVTLTLLQGALFQWQYRAYGRSSFARNSLTQTILPGYWRSRSPKPSRPIYLADAEPIPGYIQAFWYSTLQRLPVEPLQRLPPDHLHRQAAL